MAVFDNNEVKNMLDACFGVSAYTFVTGAPQLRLCTVVGSDSAAGTLVTGGSYAHQSCAFTASVAASRQIVNTGTVSFTGMPVATVNAVEIYAQNATTRKAYGLLGTAGTPAPKTTAAGDTLSFAPGAIVVAFG